LRQRRDDDPNGPLGLDIHMDGETLSVAQKVKDNNLVGVPTKSDPYMEWGGPAPPGETDQEKIIRGKKILRELRKDDPGSGDLGLNINMGGENLSIAQKSKKAYIDENNYVVFTDHPDPLGEGPQEKIQRGK